MAKLHELLAAEKTVNGSWNTLLEETKKKLGNEHFFNGYIKTLKMLESTPANEAIEAGSRDEKVLNTTVYDTFEYALSLFAKAEDLQLQKNTTNARAKADVEFRGQKLFTGLPVDQLLGLEARLNKIRDLFVAMPTIDATKNWSRNPNLGKHVLEAAPEVAYKAEKELTFVIAAPATDKHPAQVREVTREKTVGAYTKVARSGACTATQKAESIKLIDELITEVKKARMRANDTEVDSNTKIGEKLVSLLLSELAKTEG